MKQQDNLVLPSFLSDWLRMRGEENTPEKLHLPGARENDFKLFELIGYENIGQSNLEVTSKYFHYFVP